MTGSELLDVADRIEREQGLQFVMLTIPSAARRHRLSFRRRILPGKPSVFGQVVGSTLRDNGRGVDQQHDIVSVRCADIRRWLLANLQRIEAMAIANMQTGQVELAEQQLEEYRQLRDRLTQTSAADLRGGRI